MSYFQKALKAVMQTFLFTVLAGALGYLIRIVLARRLTVEDYGLFYAVFTLFWFIAYFRDWGLSSALVKFIPEFLVKRAHVKLANAVKGVLLFQFVTGITLAIIMAVGADWLAANYFHDPAAALLVRIFAVVFVLKAMKESGRIILQGFQRMFAYSALNFLENTLLLFFVLFFLGMTATALAPVLSYLAVFAILVPLNLTLALRGKGIWERTFRFDVSLFKKLSKFGFSMMLGGLASMVYLYTDTMVLTYFRSLSEVGIYSVVVVAAMMLTFLSRPLLIVLFPMVSELWTRRKTESLRAGVRLAHTYTLIVVLPFGFAFIAFPKTLLSLLFGQEYVAGAIILQILVVATFALVIAVLNLNILNSMGYPQISRNQGVIAALINLVLNIILIPFYGMYAAAVTTLISYVVLFLFSSRALEKCLPKSLPWMGWSRIVLAGAGMLTILFLIKSYFTSLPTLFSVVVPALLAGLCYVALLFFFRAVTLEDYNFFKFYLSKIFKRV